MDKVLTTRTKEILKEQTLKYEGNKDTLKRNTIKTGIGIATLVAMYFVPGPQPLVDVAAGSYTALKAYQSFMDLVS